MFTPQQLQEFFESNDIPLTGEKEMSNVEITEFIFKSANLGVSFGSFILYTVVNYEKTGISTNFETWDYLYEAYCNFVSGFLRTAGADN